MVYYVAVKRNRIQGKEWLYLISTQEAEGGLLEGSLGTEQDLAQNKEGRVKF